MKTDDLRTLNGSLDGRGRREAVSHHRTNLRHYADDYGDDQPSFVESRSTRDRQLVNQARVALDQSGYEPLRRVKTYCDHGRITLQGSVATYFLKQVAQEAISRIVEPRDIDNDLHVVSPR